MEGAMRSGRVMSAPVAPRDPGCNSSGCDSHRDQERALLALRQAAALCVVSAVAVVPAVALVVVDVVVVGVDAVRPDHS